MSASGASACGQAQVLPVEPLERAVRPEVDHRVGAEAHRRVRAQPAVRGDVLVVRREVLGVIQLGVILAPAPRRLREHHDIAVAQRRNDQAAVRGHQVRVAGLAPVREHLGPQVRRVALLQPAAVVAQPHPHAPARGQQRLELARRVPADVPRPGGHLLEQRVGRQVHAGAAQVVAGRPHPLQDVGQRLGDVEVARPDAGLARRIVVEENRHALVGVRRGGQRGIAQGAPDGHGHPRCNRPTGNDGQPGLAVGEPFLAAHHRRGHQARQLRHGHLERPLEHRQPLRRRAPLRLAAPIEADQADHRDVELPERAARLGTGEAEQERQRDIGARSAVRIEKQRFEGDAGRIAEERDRFRPLALDLGNHGVDEGGVAVVEARSVEADRHPRGPGPALAGDAPPRVELLPGGEHAAALSVRIVVAGFEAGLRLRDGEIRNARGRQHVLQQAELVREARVLPEGARAPVPCHALLFVVLARQQALPDTEHQPPGGDLGNQVQLVRRVEPLQRVLLVDVEDQHVAAGHVGGVHAVEQRFRHVRDRHAVAQVRTLVEQPLPGGQDAGQRGIAGEERETDFLRARRRGQAACKQQGGDDSSLEHRSPARQPAGTRCRAVPPDRPGSRRSARRPRSRCRA